MITFYKFLEAQEQPLEIKQRPIGSAWLGGWKIHLRTGTDVGNRDKAYAILQTIIKHAGNNKWFSKKLKGGEADQKDITLYCGTKEEALKAARSIKNYKTLYDLILPPNNEILQDDILIDPNIPNIYGRFEASRLDTSPFVFHQYGCKGWSMLKSDVEKKLSAQMRKTNDFDKEKACQKAYNALSKLFGKDFTG